MPESDYVAEETSPEVYWKMVSVVLSSLWGTALGVRMKWRICTDGHSNTPANISALQYSFFYLLVFKDKVFTLKSHAIFILHLSKQNHKIFHIIRKAELGLRGLLSASYWNIRDKNIENKAENRSESNCNYIIQPHGMFLPCLSISSYWQSMVYFWR